MRQQGYCYIRLSPRSAVDMRHWLMIESYPSLSRNRAHAISQQLSLLAHHPPPFHVAPQSSPEGLRLHQHVAADQQQREVGSDGVREEASQGAYPQTLRAYVRRGGGRMS